SPREHTMARILLLCLASLFVSASCHAGPPQAATGSRPATQNKTVWVRYEDLAEHAFAFEAPQSWEVKGGSYRFGYFDVRWMVDVRSPDSKILLRLNDANVPSYVLPSMFTPRDGPRIALVYARTTLYRMPNQANFWTVAPVISALVTPDNLPITQTIAEHMLNSIEKNPQWVLYQKQIEQSGLQNIQRNFQIFMQQMQQYHNTRTQAWNQQV